MKYSARLLPYVLITPILVFLGVFVIYPAVYSLVLSFHDVDPYTGQMFYNELAHFKELASSEQYHGSLITTLLFIVYTVPTSIVVSLILAILLDMQPMVRGFFRTIFLLPVGVSPAMAAMLWIFLYNPSAGYLNYLLTLIGIDGPSWLADPTWALVSVSIATIWKEIGFNIIFFLAGLAAVPRDMLEAAYMDGAGPWQRFRNVTLPMISPTLFFVTVVSVIHSFESFGQIHILTRGGPADATNVLVYKLYRDAFENFRPGYASAQALVLFALILIATVVQFRVAKKRVHYQ